MDYIFPLLNFRNFYALFCLIMKPTWLHSIEKCISCKNYLGNNSIYPKLSTFVPHFVISMYFIFIQ
jgi:hypothetical protein